MRRVWGSNFSSGYWYLKHIFHLVFKDQCTSPPSCQILLLIHICSFVIHISDGSGRSRRAKDYCRKVALEIDLNNLYKGVTAVSFIFPTRLNAGLCTGQCTFPLNHAVSPTNHAVVMLMMYIKNGVKNRERPYCVPTHYRGMSILIMDKNNRVKIELWKTALVKSCGCR